MVAEDAVHAPADRGIDQALAALNAGMANMGQPFKLAIVDPADLKELDKNAHYMTHEVFKNLTENVKRDGALASVPFCWFDGTHYHVLSGNHRVKSAVAAGLKSILILFDDRPLTRQERVAIQLSHNSINGKDDPTILAELWKEIDDLGLKYYSGFDDKQMQSMADATLKAMNDAVLTYKTVTFLFLPEEVDDLKAAFAKAREAVVADEAFVTRARDFEKLIDALDKSKASFGITNSAVGMLLVLELFNRHLEDLRKGWLQTAEDGTQTAKHHKQVPLASVFGTDKIPAKTALVLQKAVADMVSKGEVPKAEPWLVLEKLAVKPYA